MGGMVWRSRWSRLVPAWRAAWLLALAVSLVGSTEAVGVEGGRFANRADWPWFATVNDGASAGCGAVLISPSRMLTSAGCAGGRGDRVQFASFRRTTTGAAYHPRFARHLRRAADRECRLRLCAPALAVLWLNRPVRSVRPVAVAIPRPGPAVMIGVGRFERASGRLRQAEMLIRDTPRCTRVFHRLFGPHTMVCAVNHAGAVPCSTDLGGPLMQSDGARWKVVGVLSHWGRHIDCGQLDHPVLFAKTDRFREFLYDRRIEPWPAARGPARVTGDARVNGTLRCVPPRFTLRPFRLTYRWEGSLEATGATYVVRQDDVGISVSCLIGAWNLYGEGIASAERMIP
jgi:secreted trypsin-like serine protease